LRPILLILFAGWQTPHIDAFPLLVNFVATDGYSPRQLTKRGHRLAFSNGILLLSGGGILLVTITAGSVEHLVAFLRTWCIYWIYLGRLWNVSILHTH
jgi:hypothetical protein